MKSKSIKCIFIFITIAFLITGCGKKYFFEYNCNWQCDNPYIYIDIEHHTATFNSNNNDIETTVNAGWKPDGTEIVFYSLDNLSKKEGSVRTTIKDGKLHIYNLFKKGDEYILKQVDNFE